jgi:hypothetical protein
MRNGGKVEEGDNDWQVGVRGNNEKEIGQATSGTGIVI